MSDRQWLVAMGCIVGVVLLLVVFGHAYRNEAIAFLRAVKHAL